MRHSQFLVLFATILVLAVLTACASAPTTQSQSVSDVQITETKSQTQTRDQIVRINNCGGKADSKQVEERTFSVNVDGGIGGSIGVSSISAKYGQAQSTTKRMELTAPPGTSMEFTLRWTEQQWIGVLRSGNQSGNYDARIPVAVEQVSSKDLGCGTGVQSVAPASSSQSPTAARSSSSTAPTQAPLPPTALPVRPTATSVPLYSGPILNVGQAQSQNGMRLVLESTKFEYSKLRVMFVLYNNANSQVLFNYGTYSFSARNNLGSSAGVYIYNGCVPQISVCYAGNEINLDAGNSLQIDMEFSDLDYSKSQVTEIVITVKELARIKDTNWRVMVPH